ncbi:MAG: DUF1287 domain-containing protein [Bacillota bacterium]
MLDRDFEPVWGPYRGRRRRNRYRLRHPGRLALLALLVLFLVLAWAFRPAARSLVDLAANRLAGDSGTAASVRRAEVRIGQESDLNRNGLPDNLDVLDGAYRSLVQRPRYDDRYLPLSYPGGDVPADQAGRADLVVRALREAGYDLQQLVHEDIQAELERVGGKIDDTSLAYPLLSRWQQQGPDASIDHRRVLNLYVYLQRHAVPVTLEIRGRTSDWWPGDLVVFARGDEPFHIGIVSDRLGRGGIPRVIDAAPGMGVTQSHSLLAWPVVGHFRIAN